MVDNSFTTAFGEVNFDTEAEAFFRNKYGGKMRALFEDTKGFEIFVFVESSAFGEAVFVERILNFAGWSKDGNEDSNNTEDD